MLSKNLDNAVSLFSGIGGFEIALEQNGIRTAATVEIDTNARGVLKWHWPDAKHFEDIKDINGSDLIKAGFKPDTGILVGGFPCQSFSVAGKMAGVSDTRGTLFWDILRLVREIQPRALLLENVPGLLTIDNSETLKLMLNLLYSSGYDIDLDIYDAQNYGVPQRRKRVFILCQHRKFRDHMPTHERKRDPKVTKVLGTSIRCLHSLLPDPEDCPAPGLETILEDSTTIDEKYHLSQKSCNGILERGSRHGKSLPPSLERALRGDTSAAGVFVKAGRAQTNTSAESWKPAGIHPTVSVFDSGDSRAVAVVASLGAPLRRLSPVEYERLQGFPGDWTKHRTDPKRGPIEQTDPARYKQIGNAVAVPVVTHILQEMQAQ